MKKRIELSDTADNLSHNPFAALAGAVPENLPEHEAAPPKPPEVETPWMVGKTRKGGFAISLERRAKGKQVTVLGHVSGDADALLKELKHRCGAGGVVRDGAIELQGDHQAAIAAFLATRP